MARWLCLLLLLTQLSAAATGADDSRCLTGNAPPELASRNAEIAGRYTYYDAGTFAYMFPRTLAAVKTKERTYDEGNRSGGWVSFGGGKLTDGDPQTVVGWPHHWENHRGVDLYFDLGAEYMIDSVEMVVSESKIRNIHLWLQSPGEERETLVHAGTDRASFAKDFLPTHESPYVIKDVNASARWLRMSGTLKGGRYEGWSEIRIWGRPMSTGVERPVKRVAAPMKGEFIIAEPKPVALAAVPARAAFPIPQEMTLGEGAFALSAATRIVVPSGASARTERTAGVFAADLKEATGIELKVERAGDAATASEQTILFAGTDAKLPAQGYALKVTPKSVIVTGGDDQGLFYGTQSLVQLAGLNTAKQWDIPACDVRDWPSKPIRFVSGTQLPTEGLLRAMGRYRVTHYAVPAGATVEMAIVNRQVAEDHFVQIVPSLGWELSWQPDPESLVERPEGEKLSDMATGRRSPCPSDERVWSYYFSQIDKVIACYGEYVRVGMDEMYHAHAGARWNVCPRCRARNLPGHELMADTISRIHAYLASKGKKVCIIDSPFCRKGLSYPEDSENDWRKAVNLVPNNMLVYVWHPKEVFEPLRQAGFPMLKWSVSAFKEEIEPGYQGQYLNLSDGPFYVEQLLAMSQLCWSPGQALPGTGRCTAYVEWGLPGFRRLWTGERLPSREPGATFVTVDLSGAANTSLTDDVAGDGVGFADLGGNYDLRSLPTGRQTLTGVPFEILSGPRSAVMVQNRLVMNKRMPERAEIAVGQKAASLVFLHTLDDRPGQNYMLRKELCGYYFIVYADGKYDKLEIKYNINIANFDGVNTWWDYSPRAESLKRGTLAWRGQTGTGQDATLYYTEWTNSRPEVEISKVILASPHMPVPAAPVLIAMTAVKVTEASGAVSNPPVLRDVAYITPVVPRGVPIDLTDGVSESDLAWRTKDGTVIKCSRIDNRDRTPGCEPFWARAACAVYDNLEFARTGVPPSGSQMIITLPAPRKLAGVALTGAYRDEFYSNDFPHSLIDYTMDMSPDGKSWKPVTKEKVVGYIAEEEGPKYHDLGDQPVQAIRIHLWRNDATVAQYYRGIEYVQLFAAE